MPEIQTIKKCSRCGKEKLISEFTKDKKTKDGLRSHCRKCRSEEHKIWYNGPSHEKTKEYVRNYSRNYNKRISVIVRNMKHSFERNPGVIKEFLETDLFQNLFKMQEAQNAIKS